MGSVAAERFDIHQRPTRAAAGLVERAAVEGHIVSRDDGAAVPARVPARRIAEPAVLDGDVVRHLAIDAIRARIPEVQSVALAGLGEQVLDQYAVGEAADDEAPSPCRAAAFVVEDVEVLDGAVDRRGGIRARSADLDDVA